MTFKLVNKNNHYSFRAYQCTGHFAFIISFNYLSDLLSNTILFLGVKKTAAWEG